MTRFKKRNLRYTKVEQGAYNFFPKIATITNGIKTYVGLQR